MATRRHFLKSALCGTGILLSAGRCHLGNASEVGQVYPGWREGEIDIHHIYTGFGESNFCVFPDGTSMLIDAGDWSYKTPVPHLPNESRRSGEWIARYIQRINPFGSSVDYMMLSHYHPDHAGMPQPGAEVTSGRGEDYSLSGLAHTAEFLHYTQAFDRGYPDYSDPAPVSNPTADNFRRFTQWAMKENGLKMEKFVPGQLDQIKLQKSPETYDFHIRNLCSNGEVWTGVGTDTHDFIPEWTQKKAPKENPLSLGMTIQYGAFRYYTGGDVDLSILLNKEPVPVEKAVGQAAGPVDVCKVNHHASENASTPEFLTSLQARTYISTVWVATQPGRGAVERMMSEENYSGPRQLFPTLFNERCVTEYADAPWYDNVAKDGGHVVLKVFDSGKQYKVYYLTAEDESMKVKAVYGPFESTGTAREAAFRGGDSK